MLREYELIDRFCRSDEYRRLLADQLEEQTAHFITRYLVDSALASRSRRRESSSAATWSR